MPFLSLELTKRIRAQHGVITTQQLREMGVSDYRRRAHVKCGTLLRVHQGVYVHTACDPTLRQQALAACLATPLVVASGPTAGRLHNLRRMPTGSLHVMTRCTTLKLEGVVVHRTTDLRKSDIVTLPNGMRVLAIPRLLFDLARFLDDDDLESVIEQCLHRRLTTIPALFAMARRLAKSGRDGTTRFWRVLNRRPAWAKPAHSNEEVKLLIALRNAGLVLDRQVAVELPNGDLVHLDGGDPARRFGVEVDHVTWHGGRVVTEYDEWRTRQLERIGWVVPRVSDTAVNEHLAATVRDLVEIHARCPLDPTATTEPVTRPPG